MPEIHYRLGGLIDRAADQGVLSQLLAIAALEREHEHTHFIPGVVIGASGDGPPRETDLYGVCDGIVLAGEAKTSPRSFCVDEVERDVELSAALDADAHVMVAFEKIAEAVTREAKRCAADNSLGLIVIGGEHLGTLVPPRMR